LLAVAAPAAAQPAPPPAPPTAPEAAAPKPGRRAPAKRAPAKRRPAGPLAPAKEPEPPAPGGAAAPAPAPGPTAPAAPAPAAPATPAAAAAPVAPAVDDAPPADLEGRDENPNAPRLAADPPPAIAAEASPPPPAGYPRAEAARPITLPRNMFEVAIGPHFQASPYQGTDALRARYGVTDRVQLGLTYVLGGVFDDPLTPASTKLKLSPGKAVGLDLTYAIRPWVGARLGVPVYVDPLAASIQLAAPMRWRFRDGTYAIGALDELITIRVKRFAPSFYQEAANARAAAETDEMGSRTLQSRGALRFTGYGVMQRSERLALIARLGITMDDFSSTKTERGGGLTTALRAGLQYSPRRYLDLGASLGFDDLAALGSFGLAGLLAVRI
jgi:hypothetical protein